jgi:hypothetical protein
MEEVVLLAAPALCALKAAHQQKRHTHGYEDGQQIRICRKPMNQFAHKPDRIHAATPNPAAKCLSVSELRSAGLPGKQILPSS